MRNKIDKLWCMSARHIGQHVSKAVRHVWIARECLLDEVERDGSFKAGNVLVN